MDELLTTVQVAERLNMSENWVRDRMRKRPLIPYVKMGRSVRFRATDVEQFVAYLVDLSRKQQERRRAS